MMPRGYTHLAFLFLFIILTSFPVFASEKKPYEIVVKSAEVEKTVEWFKNKKFWGATTHDKDLDVPRLMIAVVSKQWATESQKVPVDVKKELFYRALVPMVLYANELILRDRKKLLALDAHFRAGKSPGSKELEHMKETARKYGVEGKDPSEILPKLLDRVNTIPPSLALGQAAYESGYGTSRFMMEGNALFGQWTYGGGGMQPQQKRESKGDYGVAAYEWPFDSIRSYMHNLNTHPSYQELREERKTLEDKGKKPRGIDLAETLTSYSEKGPEYVKTLQSIIRVNGLDVADNAFLRNEPMTLIVGVKNKAEMGDALSELEKLEASGELDRIIKSMNLDLDKE